MQLKLFVLLGIIPKGDIYNWCIKKKFWETYT
jgi:hypothetical protein